MNPKHNGEVMLEIFAAIERRDPRRMLELCHADVEFHWPGIAALRREFARLASVVPTLDRHVALSSADGGRTEDGSALTALTLTMESATCPSCLRMQYC
jgi:ketosteroid isomerase-like protein